MCEAAFAVKYYSRAELQDSPSRKDGIDADKEGFFMRSMGSFMQRMATELKAWVLPCVAHAAAALAGGPPTPSKWLFQDAMGHPDRLGLLDSLLSQAVLCQERSLCKSGLRSRFTSQ